jgi:hypothetical protein
MALAGYAPWFTFETWGRLFALGQTIEFTITDPIARINFVSNAAITLQFAHPDMCEELLNDNALDDLIDTAELTRATPLGATELWGSAIQGLPLNGE